LWIEAIQNERRILCKICVEKCKFREGGWVICPTS
jgi:hypothetical protein